MRPRTRPRLLTQLFLFFFQQQPTVIPELYIDVPLHSKLAIA